MVNRVWIAALLALGFAAPPHRAEGASKWLRLRSAHFVLVGDASDGDLRAVAERVEAFREVLTQTLPGQAALSAVPTVIVVFGSSQSFTPYKPLYQGKPAEVGGYFVGREDINYIALNVAGGPPPIRSSFTSSPTSSSTTGSSPCPSG